MSIVFPSGEFDDAVAAVCHGLAIDEQMRLLNELLRTNSAARDEYLLRVELHARLASDPDLSQAVETRWNSAADSHSVGAALEPGWLRLRSGLVQVTFCNGARLLVEGPA
jgi:hypothetical protein